MKGPLLIVFLRKPELGKVKTRLAASVGAERALAIYEELLRHTLEQAGRLPIQKQAWFTGDAPVDELVSTFGFTSHVQYGNDLGERMLNAFCIGFANDHAPVLIIGTDCPGISTALIQDALRALDDNDAVIGPARDGGYYLLGLNEPLPALFLNKAWSTSQVAADTMKDLEQHGRSVFLLPMLIDVDTEEDLRDVEWDPRPLGPSQP